MQNNKTMKKEKRQLEGVVMTNKMTNAVTVRVINKKLHPLYKKVVKQYRKYMAKNSIEGIEVGDKVRIEETRPMSKSIRWVVIEKLANK